MESGAAPDSGCLGLAMVAKAMVAGAKVLEAARVARDWEDLVRSNLASGWVRTYRRLRAYGVSNR
jgi:hypothetical protein